MLFGYPIAATAENWLHECLVEMVQTIHANHANHDGRQVALAWPPARAALIENEGLVPECR